MAPELVQEQPYNHSVDIWSYGIILFELFAGQPPFYTNNLYSLIKMIVRNPVKYPSNMSSEFKSFLKGLLIKEPSKRMSWPEILEHPFLRANHSDLEEESRVRAKYNRWLRQVGQWNKDFEEFKSSKIDFFTSEVYTFDDNGFTGHNSSRSGKPKKGRRGSRAKDQALSVDSASAVFEGLLKAKDPGLETFLERFAEAVPKAPSKAEAPRAAKEFDKVCAVLRKVHREAPDLFGAKRKPLLVLSKKLQAFMERLRDKKCLATRLRCLSALLLLAELKDSARVAVGELSYALGAVNQPSPKVSLALLDAVAVLFEKMTANFSESQGLLQDLLSKKILHALFSVKKGVVSAAVLQSAKGRTHQAASCSPRFASPSAASC